MKKSKRSIVIEQHLDTIRKFRNLLDTMSVYIRNIYPELNRTEYYLLREQQEDNLGGDDDLDFIDLFVSEGSHLSN